MSLRVIVRPEARAEITEAHDWYEAQQAGLGEQFEEALSACYERICEHPDAFPHATQRLRRARVERFPYLVFYEVVGDSVVVQCVFHDRRNPDVWLKRTTRDE
jgi:plasmid stabilization system protein ParE